MGSARDSINGALVPQTKKGRLSNEGRSGPKVERSDVRSLLVLVKALYQQTVLVGLEARKHHAEYTLQLLSRGQ